MTKAITSHDAFVDAINILEKYTQKVTLLGGFDQLTAEEEKEYQTLAQLVADYEDTIPVFPSEPNQPFEKLILIYMMDARLTMSETAKWLNIPKNELKDILAGKKRVDKSLSQKLYDVLGLKTDMLLQNA